jgi:Ca-activated chloride channel family protein
MIKFAQPYFLILLLIPIGYLFFYYTKKYLKPASLAYSDTDLFAQPKISIKTIIYRVLPVLKAVALALAVIAVARPQTSLGQRQIYTEGIDIMLALDISGSMQAEDFKPQNRLEASKEVIRNFIKGRQGDRIGLVAFSRQAFTQCPLTTDYQLLAQFVDQVNFGMVEDGTAIGLALATAANRLIGSDAKSKIIILLTDGANNAGEIDPITAAKAISALGIKVYTIGAGTEGMVDMPVMDPVFGKRFVRLQSDIDEDLLQKVAAMTGGQFFRAKNSQALQDIYDQISKMEKSKIEVKEYFEYNELFGEFLLAGLLLFIGELFLGAAVVRSLP